MLSERFAELAEQILKDFAKLDEMIAEETNGRWGVCVPGNVQLNPSIFAEPQPDKQELEGLVGPVEYFCTGTYSLFYKFKLGNADMIAGVNKDKSEGTEE